MAKDTFYFSHDSNARNDEKLIALRMRLDWKGYGLFWAIIEKMRESTNYMCVKDYNLIAFDLRCDASLIKSIVEEFGLFVFAEDGKYFYSERLHRTIAIIEKKSEAAKLKAEKRWKKDEKKDEENAESMLQHSNGNAKKVNESKGKEIKEKEIVIGADAPKHPPKSIETFEKRETDFYNSIAEYKDVYPKELLRAFFDYWREPNKSKSKMKFEQESTWELKLRLERWSNNDFNKKNTQNGGVQNSWGNSAKKPHDTSKTQPGTRTPL